MIWSFGRLDGLDIGQAVLASIVVAFPAAIGAGIAQVAV